MSRVVLVGRPNVGKSTLFNRVAGGRRAIVTATPGTTRDVLVAPVEWRSARFELVDTGGLFGASDDPLQAEVAAHGLRAIDRADVVLVVVDGRQGLVPADHEVVARTRRLGVPMLLVVNKVEDRRAATQAVDFHALGIEPVMEVAAEHGLGVGDLLDEVVQRLPRASQGADAEAGEDVAIAIVGRPNVGKSSLVNRIAGGEHVLVSDLAGTTRDAVDTVCRWRGQRLRLVDTAGMRRPGRIVKGGRVESVSVTLARRAMTRADVAVVVVDAVQGVGHRDAAIAGEAERAGCGVVIAANKWDLVKGRGEAFAKHFDETLRATLKFASYAPIVHLSALTGSRLSRLLEAVDRVAAARGRHVATSELNRFMATVTAAHPPSSPAHRDVRIQYATQTGVKPPRFMMFTNTATAFHFSYERFLTNRLREAFGFIGSPIRLQVRARRPPARRR